MHRLMVQTPIHYWSRKHIYPYSDRLFRIVIDTRANIYYHIVNSFQQSFPSNPVYRVRLITHDLACSLWSAYDEVCHGVTIELCYAEWEIVVHV